MCKIATLGEILMRLSPPNHERFIQTKSFDTIYGGAEANVAVGLSNLGVDVKLISKVPDNELGLAAINEFRKYGVDTSGIMKGGQRLGLYFLEKGASVRPSRVIYDRLHSSMSQAQVDEFDFDHLLTGVSWFHFTGITPAISESALAITIKALETCRRKGITVSMDFNYREKLWTKQEAKKAYQQLMKYVDVCIANELDAEAFLDINVDHRKYIDGVLTKDGYEEVYHAMMQKYKLMYIVSTKRKVISSSHHEYSAQIYDGHGIYTSKEYDLTIVDRIGGGDAFASGLIYGLVNNYDAKSALEIATASSAIKHTIVGDANHISIQEVIGLVNQDNLKVKR